MTVVRTVPLALKSQFNMAKAQAGLGKAVERLATGLRVNSAKDDAAGLAIGNRFQAQADGLNQASRNANDGISLSQTAHGALDQINDRLQRVRQLSVQALNGTLSVSDADAIQAEINSSLKEIDRLAATTQFNGIPLMNGQAGRVGLQTGANDGQKLSLDLGPPGFGVAALGLEDLNIAGTPGSVSERKQLDGQAVDIPLYADSTTLSFAAGSTQPLFYTDAFGYYTPDGTGGFARASVTASHETATDTSEVSIHSPQALFSHTLRTTGVDAGDLVGAGERLVQVDGTAYVQERQYVGGHWTYGYREVSFEQQQPSGVSGLARAATVEAGNYAAVSGDFTVGGDTYNLDDAANVSFLRSSGATMTNGQLVEADGALYLQDGNPGSERYFRLDSVTRTDRLMVTADATPSAPAPGMPTEVLGPFVVGGNIYQLDNFDEVTGQPVGSTLVEDANGFLFWRTGAGVPGDEYAYYAFTAASAEHDLALQGQATAFLGVDWLAEPSLGGQVLPPTDFTGFGGTSFQGADFSGLSNLTVVRSTAPGQPWLIRGQRGDGGFAYFNAAIDVDFDSSRALSAVTATATQPTPTVLGIPEHERTTVSGTSVITIDPRNVSVQYTDADGQTWHDVLTQNEDGNYYFELPDGGRHGDDKIGSYKTATLTDLDGTSEVLLRTENGNNQVVIFYPSNVSQGSNLSVVALTDGNGFSDSGIPHTRLHIREAADGYRLSMPRNPLAAIDRAIGMVDAKRSYLGATENRLESVIAGNQSAEINLNQARSRIVDADYAVETANLTKFQILQQASTSMLAQANQTPQQVLRLLGQAVG